MTIHKMDSANHVPLVGTGLLASVSGVVQGVSYGTAATANHIVQRDGSGQINVPLTPTAANHAASKDYSEGIGLSIGSYVEDVTIGANATTFDFSSVLNGNVDFHYRILGVLVNPVAGLTYNLRINGANAVGVYQRFHCNNATITAARVSAVNLAFAEADATNSISFEILIPYTPTGSVRHYFSRVARSGANMQLMEYVGYMTTPASGTNITSIGIAANLANGIGAGSFLSLTKRVL